MTTKMRKRRHKKKSALTAAVPLLAVVLALLIWVAVSLPELEQEPQGGWQEIDGVFYYEDNQGNYVSGWQTIDGKVYYFNPANGCAMATGWLKLDEDTYYLDENGHTVSGWQTVEGENRYFDENGKMLRGWITLTDGIYYLSESGSKTVGWLELEGKRYHLGQDGRMVTGWVEDSGKRYYMDAQGVMSVGWIRDGNDRYCLSDSGVMQTGWVEENGYNYYLQSNGKAAKGKLVVDGKTCYFTSTGAQVLLVNRWNTLPQSYAPEKLVASKYNTSFDCKMIPVAAAALDAMIADCKAAGFSPLVRTGYRSYGYQQALLNNKLNNGIPYEEAIKSVAAPGSSEHQTGLAVDVSDSVYTDLNREQGAQPIQKWLMENCYKHGFIVRYPDGTTDKTGIIYESWHYRYVGVELATELHALGVCLEQYLDDLTNDGTTCGDPGSVG